MNRIAMMVVGGVLCVTGADPVVARLVDGSYHERFEDVEPGTRLVLRHGDGDVTITPWDQDAVEIDVRYRVEVTKVGLGGTPDFDVKFDRRGDTIWVEGIESGTFTIGFRKSRKMEYTYTVRAPAWLGLSLTGDDGDVSIEDWTGDIQADLDDGDVELSGVDAASLTVELEDGDLRADRLRASRLTARLDDGDVRLTGCVIENGELRMQDGSLVLRDCEGDLDVAADDGDVRLEGHRAGALQIRTEDGDVEVELLASAAVIDVSVTTDDASVAIALAPEISTTFSISTDDGGITVDCPGVADLQLDKGRATGRLGDGAGEIRVRTSDGDVTLRTLSG